MYFLVALGGTIIAGLLWFIFRNKKTLRLDILTITFGASMLMWLIDVIFTAARGEVPLTFEAEDMWISLWTVLGALAFWGVLTTCFYFFNKKESKAQQA